ncbi:hypothetical protein Tco_1209281 [Tanacetum coccineum]
MILRFDKLVQEKIWKLVIWHPKYDTSAPWASTVREVVGTSYLFKPSELDIYLCLMHLRWYDASSLTKMLSESFISRLRHFLDSESDCLLSCDSSYSESSRGSDTPLVVQKLECYNYLQKGGHFARGVAGLQGKQKLGMEEHKNGLCQSEINYFECFGLCFVKVLVMIGVIQQRRRSTITELRGWKLELAQKQKDKIQLTVENFKNLSKSLSKLVDCQIVDKCKTVLGYNVVPPPYTGNFMPPKPDLTFTSLEEFTSEPIVIKHVVENSEAKASEAKPKAVRKNNGAPIIKDWVSDCEEEHAPQAKIEKKIVKSSFTKIKFVKPK